MEEDAPPWVQSVTLAQIAEQRKKGWVDFHPENFCHECGQRNPVWWVSSKRWNTAYPDSNPIVCPNCFILAYSKAIGSEDNTGGWELRLDPNSSLYRQLHKEY